MEVAITSLRAELSSWVERARTGEEVVITDRGTPVARLLGVDAATLIDHLVERGVLSKPSSHVKPSARASRRARATGPVADLVGDERR